MLRPAILWNDQRTQAQCDAMRRLIGRDRLISVSGNDALTGFTAPKILWVAEHEPDVFDRTAHVLLPKDYVRLMLTGVHATDAAGGSGTILFDLAERTWSDQIAKDLGIPRTWLPDVFEGTDITGVINAQANKVEDILFRVRGGIRLDPVPHAVWQGGDVTTDQGRPNSRVQRREIGRQGAATRVASAADSLRVNLRERGEVIEPSHAIPDPVFR